MANYWYLIQVILITTVKMLSHSLLPVDISGKIFS